MCRDARPCVSETAVRHNDKKKTALVREQSFFHYNFITFF